MRIIYILIICSLAGVLLLWLGIYKKISRKTASVGAALSLALAGALLLLAVLPGNSFYGSCSSFWLPKMCMPPSSWLAKTLPSIRKQ